MPNHIHLLVFRYPTCTNLNTTIGNSKRFLAYEIVKVLDYIHHNPAGKKWMLVDDFVKYPYSSAQYYLTGDQNAIDILDYSNVWDSFE